jgi:predicted RNase H-like nuclease (RuvC/YqgF family)
MGVVAQALEAGNRIKQELLDDDPTLGKPENWQVLQDTVEGETNTMDLARWFARKKVELEEELKDRWAVIERRKKDLAEKQARAKSLENRMDRINDLAFMLAQAVTPQGKKVEIKAPDLTAHVRTQSDTQRALIEVEPGDTPEEYVLRREPVFDKQAIKEALVNKRPVPGWLLANAKTVFVIKAR